MTSLQMMSCTETETMQIAEFIAKMLKPGDVLTLEGDLGAGKTTFTKGLALGLEIKRAVTSPTFTISKQYEGTFRFNHIDAYRLEHSDEDIGFDDYFFGDSITVVEWAQFIADYLPEERLNITLDYVDESKRKLTFEPVGDHFIEVIKLVEKQFAGRRKDDEVSN